MMASRMGERKAMAVAVAMAAVVVAAAFSLANAQEMSPPPTDCKTYRVGGSYGWRVPPSVQWYQDWLSNTFPVTGKPQICDTLVFDVKGNVPHNVFLSNVSNPFSLYCKAVYTNGETQFQHGHYYAQDINPGGSVSMKIVPGYYAISDPQYCKQGMHLYFRVLAPANASPPPPATPAPSPPFANGNGVNCTTGRYCIYANAGVVHRSSPVALLLAAAASLAAAFASFA